MERVAVTLQVGEVVHDKLWRCSFVYKDTYEIMTVQFIPLFHRKLPQTPTPVRYPVQSRISLVPTNNRHRVMPMQATRMLQPLIIWYKDDTPGKKKKKTKQP